MSRSTIRRQPVATAVSDPADQTLRETLIENPSGVEDTVSLSFLDRFIVAAIIFGGTLVLLAVIAYLTFLWFGDPSSSGWKLIVLSDWVATSVTICGLAIRWTSSFQMVLGTSIIAWNMLKAGSPLSKIARLSTLRYNNSGPLDIIILQPFKLKPALGSRLFLLAAAGTIIAIWLQLSSTLLLSDITARPAETFRNSSSYPVLSDEIHNITRKSYYTDALLTTPPSYPLFAELPPDGVPNHGDTVDDTGTTFRALLPVAAEEGRSQLLSFKGMAAVYDARVICTAPRLSNLSLVGHPPNLYLRGRVLNHSTLVPPMVAMDRGVDNWFNLSVFETRETGSQWSIFTYDMGSPRLGLVNGLDSVFDPTMIHGEIGGIAENTIVVPYNNKSSDAYYAYDFRPTGETWLVINMTDVTASTLAESHYTTSDVYVETLLDQYAFNNSAAWVATRSSQWARLTSDQIDGLRICTRRYGSSPVNNGECIRGTAKLGTWKPRIDFSLCSSAFPYTKTLHIDAFRHEAVQEPTTLEAGMSQINVGKAPRAFDSRGVMLLNKTTIVQQLSDERGRVLRETLQRPVSPVSHLLTFFRGTSLDAAEVIPRGIRSWYPGDSRTDKQGDWLRTSEGRAALFQRVIQETNSPAQAIQSMIHTYVTDRYYNYQPYYKNTTSRWLTYEVNAIQPVRARGFMTVMVGVTMHLLWMSYICLAYGVTGGFGRTLRSIDQAWQAAVQVALLLEEVNHEADVSVVMKEDPQPVTVFSTTTTDTDVDLRLKARNIKDQIFILDDGGDDGVVRFRASGTSGTSRPLPDG